MKISEALGNSRALKKYVPWEFSKGTNYDPDHDSVTSGIERLGENSCPH